MNRNELLTRWAVFFRWIAYAGLCAALVFGYAKLPAVGAQEKDAARPPAAGKSAPAAERPPSEAPLTPQQAQRLAEEALAADETGNKKPPVVAEKPHFDLIKEVLDRPEHMWAVWLILAVSVVAMAAAIERMLGLRRRRVVPAEFVASLKALARQKGGLDPRQAMLLCRQYPSSAATVVKTMLQKIGRPIAEIEHAVADTGEREASRLYANVRWQSLAFNVAPMLGLAGTVYGMLLAFFTTANLSLGENRMATLATGIYAALICTFAGLVVAIPAGILAHVFEGRIMKLFREIDDLMLVLMPQMERYEGRLPAAKTHAAEPAAAEPELVRLPPKREDVG